MVLGKTQKMQRYINIYFDYYNRERRKVWYKKRLASGWETSPVTRMLS